MPSSTSLQVGQDVSLELFDDGKRRKLHGRIKAIDAHSLTIHLGEGDAALSAVPGERVLVEYECEGGRAHFASTLQEIALSNGFVVRVEHPDRVDVIRKRRYTRHFVELPAIVATVGVRGASARSAKTIELGASGASVLTDRAVDPGASVRLELHLPGSAGVCSATGQVRYCRRVLELDRRPYQLGVEFTRVDASDLARLREFLRSLERRERTG